MLVVELDCQKAAYSCPGTILILPNHFPSLAREADCLYEVTDLLVLPHKTFYIPNKLGLVLASLKVDHRQCCWILLATGMGSATAVCLVAKKLLGKVNTGEVVVVVQMVTLVIDVLGQPRATAVLRFASCDFLVDPLYT